MAIPELRLPTDQEIRQAQEKHFPPGTPGVARIDADAATGHVEIVLCDGDGKEVGRVNVDGSPAARDKAEAEARVSSPIKSPAVVLGSPVKPTPTPTP